MFGQQSVVVTLERDSLLVGNQRWPYPPGTIINQELLDPKRFLGFWSDYWKSLGIKQASVLVVISDQLLFSKVTDHETLEFWDEVPIEKANMARKVIYEPDKVTMIAANRELFTAIVQGIQNSKSEVRAVVPINYSLDNESIKRSNFLNDVNSNSINKPNVGWVWFLGGAIWVGVIILIWLKILNKI